MFRRLPVIIVFTLLGTAVFGGGYFVKHVLLRGEKLYAVTSTYRVEYAVEEQEVGAVYINEMSWNTYVQSQMFLDAVRGHLKETGIGEDMDSEALGKTLKAFLASDLRMPSITVTTDSPEKSVGIAQAAEAAMTQEFAGDIREIASIAVIDPGRAAREVIPDIRLERAFGLSAILSGFFVIVVLLLQIIGEDIIRLPGTIWKRYGVKALGTIESRELAENIRYLFREQGAERAGGDGAAASDAAGRIQVMENVAVCPVQEDIDTDRVLEQLRRICPGIDRGRSIAVGRETGSFCNESRQSWFAVPAPLSAPETCRKLREAQGILLVVQARRHGGKQLEHTLEYLAQQDCTVTGVLLWEADEKLIKWYYGTGILSWNRKGHR